MNSEPKLVYRPEQPYAAIRAQVTMAELGAALPPLSPELAAWLAGQGAAPAGAPFWRYQLVSMAGQFQMEVGFPTAAVMPGDVRVTTGVLPAGRYATLLHTGHPRELYEATTFLLEWAAQHGVPWQMLLSEQGEVWRAQLEWYFTDPRVEPDMNQWQTELAFLAEDDQ